MNDTELEACIHAYGKDLYSFLYQLTGNRQEADDLYQDTFLKLLELDQRPDFTRNPKSWLLTIAVQLWKNRRRKYGWRQRIAGAPVSMDEPLSEIPSNEASPEQQVISAEEAVLVREAVRRLPDRYRLPVVLFYMEELKIAEIGQILHIPQGTVKSRLHQAKKILEKELEVAFDEKKHG
ncbi:MAG: RNA polymerase sigma factor [Eubacteriales bacterium]|nr:RNA polymerase sigma factor [Eubacteriales bacterium]